MRFFTLLTIVVLLLGTGVACAQDVKVNFSGEWIINADKSDQGGGRRGGMGMGGGISKMVVEQTENKLSVESFRKNRDGDEISTVSNYTLDGKRSKDENDFRTSISVVKWSKDGSTLTINSDISMYMRDREINMESTAIWSLEKDTLTIETTTSSQMGERTRKAVYNKAKK